MEQILTYHIVYERKNAAAYRCIGVIVAVLSMCLTIVCIVISYPIFGWMNVITIAAGILVGYNLPKVEVLYSEDACYTFSTNLIKNDLHLIRCEAIYLPLA